MVDRLVNNLRAGSHNHDNVLGFRMPKVVEKVIFAADNLCELVHSLLDDPGSFQIVLVDCLTTLEKDIRIL